MTVGSHEISCGDDPDLKEPNDHWSLSSKTDGDEFGPGWDEEPEANSLVSTESFIDRLRLVFWDFHQTYVAWALLVCLLCMSGFFLAKSYRLNGLVDIDQAAPIEAAFQIDLNSAQIGEIVVLPGVGRRLAGAIIEHRESVGGFESHENLCDVPGIGEKKLEAMRPYLLPIEVVK